MIVQGKAPPLEFLPVQVFLSFTVDLHGDTVLHRANQLAQIAAHTFLFLNGIRVIGFAIGQVDGLVRGILTGDIA